MIVKRFPPKFRKRYGKLLEQIKMPAFKIQWELLLKEVGTTREKKNLVMRLNKIRKYMKKN